MTKKERVAEKSSATTRNVREILTTRRPGARPLEGDEESMTVKLSRRKDRRISQRNRNEEHERWAKGRL
jgi:hypothetical protein